MELSEIILPSGTGANKLIPDPFLLTHYKQLEQRVLWVEGEIDESLLEITKQIMMWNSDDKYVAIGDRIPIKVCVFSPGGNLAETMHVCSIIQMSKTPVHTYNMGMAMSGGFLLLVAGHKGCRYTLPYARGLAHQGSGGVGGTFSQAKDAMKDYQDQISDMRDFILSHTTISKKDWTRMEERDWYMSAEDQIKFGVVDKIVTDINDII